jgi:hypothetical protein
VSCYLYEYRNVEAGLSHLAEIVSQRVPLKSKLTSLIFCKTSLLKGCQVDFTRFGFGVKAHFSIASALITPLIEP